MFLFSTSHSSRFSRSNLKHLLLSKIILSYWINLLMEFSRREMAMELGISSGMSSGRGTFLLNEIVKIYFIIGMFLINAKPIFCSEKSFANKFSYLLICKPLCAQFWPYDEQRRRSNSLVRTLKMNVHVFPSLPCFIHPARNVMESFKVCALQFHVRVRVWVRITRERLNFFMFRLEEIKQFENYLVFY